MTRWRCWNGSGLSEVPRPQTRFPRPREGRHAVQTTAARQKAVQPLFFPRINHAGETMTTVNIQPIEIAGKHYVGVIMDGCKLNGMVRSQLPTRPKLQQPGWPRCVACSIGKSQCRRHR